MTFSKIRWPPHTVTSSFYATFREKSMKKTFSQKVLVTSHDDVISNEI